MLLPVFFALIHFGASFSIKSICYGESYEVPIFYTPPHYTTVIYYKPRGEGRILVVNSDGQSLHKRFLVSFGSVRMTDLTEQDDGAFLYFSQRDSVQLGIKDCQKSQLSLYGDLFLFSIPSDAEYLEFAHTPSTGYAQSPVVLWNRTGMVSGRGTVKRNIFELAKLKPADRGYYKFMKAGGKLIEWKRLNVEEHSKYMEREEGDYIEMSFPSTFSISHIRYVPRHGGSDYIRIDQYLKHPRMVLSNISLAIADLRREDSGTYRFMDDEGLLAIRVDLEVRKVETATWVYLLIIGAVVLCILICCCCVKKCCCKKDSDKTNSPEAEAEAPPVYYHDNTQPTESGISLMSREPRVINAEPPTYNEVVGSMYVPPSAQVTASGGLGPTTLMPSSSDANHRFDFKGTVFPSAPPLSMDTSTRHVYTSDKLNFL